MSAETTTDQRVVRTRRAIRQALIELIAAQGFDSLSVKDIASRAGINRGTFYLHYHDKYDLLEQTEAEIIAELEQIFTQASDLQPADFRDLSQPLPQLVSLFEYLRENALLMQAVLGLKGEIAFQSKVKRAMELNLFREGFLAHIKPENLTVPSQYLITYVVSAHLGVVQLWLNSGCREPAAEMAQILMRLSITGPLSILGNG
jgi:AcrR family transcriptional regulator